MRKFFLIIVLIVSLLTVSVQSQENATLCEFITEQAIAVETYGEKQPITLPVGTLVEYVGQQPHGSAWILRQAGQYVLYSTSSPDLRPFGCEPSSWRPPPREYLPLQTVMDEVGITNWHDQGYFGQGVRVGILDTRYDDLSATIAGLPISESQVTFKPSLAELETLLPQAERTEAHHGTNVLEVMAYITPQAEYVLARSIDAASFSQAVDDLIAEDVHIIVHASNVITYDPTPYHDAVHRADAAGILWVNSAGNMGTGYYPARYSGDDIVTVHQFNDPNRAGTQSSLMVPVNPNGDAQVILVWDEAYEGVPNDFELVVYGSCNRRDQTTFEPQRSDADQSSGAPTYESVPLSNGILQQINDYTSIPSTSTTQNCPDVALPDGVQDNEVYITVVDAVGTAQIDSRFDLYIEGALPAEFDPDISISLDPVVLVPGDIAESFTVGAYDWRDNTVAWYSGRLNSLQYYELNNFDVDYSVDELIKPDIVTYGELLLPSGREFFGTSAATPLVGASIAAVYSNLTFDSQSARMNLIDNYAECLNDGVMGRNILYLSLSTQPSLPQAERCGNYAWKLDLGRTLITNFQAPELVAALNDAEREAAINRSIDLSTAALDALNNGNAPVALARAIEANNMENPPFQSQYILSQIAYSPGLRNIISIPNGDIGSLDFDPTGQWLLVGSSDNSLYLLDVVTGEQMQRFTGHNDEILCGVFSPSGSIAVSCSEDGTLIVWDVATGQILHRLAGHSAGVLDAEFSPDGNMIVSGGKDNRVILWDVETGGIIRQFSDHSETPGAFNPVTTENVFTGVHSVDFSPNGNMIVSANCISTVEFYMCAEDEVIIRNLVDGQIINRVRTGHSEDVQFVTDNSIISADFDNGNLVEWDINSEELVRFISESRIGRIDTNNDGSKVAVSRCMGAHPRTCLLGELEVVDESRITLGESLPISGYRSRPGTGGSLPVVTFSPDDFTVASSSGSAVELWDIRLGPLQTRSGTESWLTNFAILNDGMAISWLWDSRQIVTWDIYTGNVLKITQPPDVEIPTLQFIPNGTQSYIYDENNTILLVDTTSGDIISQFDYSMESVFPNLLWEEDIVLVTERSTNQMTLIDISTGDIVLNFETPDDSLGVLAKSPDNSYVAASISEFSSNNSNTKVILWNAIEGNILHRIGIDDTRIQHVNMIEFNQTGDQLLIAGCSTIREALVYQCLEGGVELWDVTTGSLIRAFSMQVLDVYDVAFSPDSRYVLVGSDDGLTLVDLNSGFPIRRLTANANIRTNNVAFTPDSLFALSDTFDDGVLIWRIDDTVSDLIDWSYRNRYIPDLDCADRIRFAIEPMCDGSGQIPTQSLMSPTLSVQTQIPTSNATITNDITPIPSPTEDVNISGTFLPEFIVDPGELALSACDDINTNDIENNPFLRTQSTTRLRIEPTTTSRQIGTIPANSSFTILNMPVCNEGFHWWLVNYAGNIGWAAGSSDTNTWFQSTSDEPTTVNVSSQISYQEFESGHMIWVEQSQQVFVLYSDNMTWDVYIDQFDAGQHMISDPTIIVPEGYFQPMFGFGLIWRTNAQVQDRLGWATDEERSYTIQIQYEDSIDSVSGQRSFRLTPEFRFNVIDNGNWELSSDN